MFVIHSSNRLRILLGIAAAVILGVIIFSIIKIVQANNLAICTLAFWVPVFLLCTSYALGGGEVRLDDTGISRRSLVWMWRGISWAQVRKVRLYRLDGNLITLGEQYLEIHGDTLVIKIAQFSPGAADRWTAILKQIRQSAPQADFIDEVGALANPEEAG